MATVSRPRWRTWLAGMLAVVLTLSPLLATVAVIFWFDSRARRRVERTTSRTHRPWPASTLRRPNRPGTRGPPTRPGR